MSADEDAAAGTDERSELRSELERLRRLIGPNEHAYADLDAELANAERAVRDAEAANGVLRGEVTELRVALIRARQDQYHVAKLLTKPGRLLRAVVRSAGPR